MTTSHGSASGPCVSSFRRAAFDRPPASCRRFKSGPSRIPTIYVFCRRRVEECRTYEFDWPVRGASAAVKAVCGNSRFVLGTPPTAVTVPPPGRSPTHFNASSGPLDLDMAILALLQRQIDLSPGDDPQEICDCLYSETGTTRPGKDESDKQQDCRVRLHPREGDVRLLVAVPLGLENRQDIQANLWLQAPLQPAYVRRLPRPPPQKSTVRGLLETSESATCGHDCPGRRREEDDGSPSCRPRRPPPPGRACSTPPPRPDEVAGHRLSSRRVTSPGAEQPAYNVAAEASTTSTRSASKIPPAPGSSCPAPARRQAALRCSTRRLRAARRRCASFWLNRGNGRLHPRPCGVHPLRADVNLTSPCCTVTHAAMPFVDDSRASSAVGKRRPGRR